MLASFQAERPINKINDSYKYVYAYGMLASFQAERPINK